MYRGNITSLSESLLPFFLHYQEKNKGSNLGVVHVCVCVLKVESSKKEH